MNSIVSDPNRGETQSQYVGEVSPVFEAERLLLLEEARMRIEELRLLLREGSFDQVPNDIDSIASARDAINDPAHLERVETDAKFSLYEAVCQTTGKNVEFFPVVTLPWNGSDFGDGHRTITEASYCGLSPLGASEEVSVREAEYVEAASFKLLAKEYVGADKSVLTISPPTTQDDRAQFMIRYSKVEYCSADDRAEAPQLQIQQVAIPLASEAHANLAEALGRIDPAYLELSPSELLKSWIPLNSDTTPDLKSWLVDNSVLSHEECEKAVRSSEKRQQFVEKYSVTLGEYALELAAEETPDFEASKLYVGKVRSMLLEVTRTNPQLATDIFGEKVGDIYHVAQLAQASGDFEEADRLWQQAKKIAPSVVICTPGSCGIRHASLREIELGVELGLNGDIVAFKSENPCNDCGCEFYLTSMQGGEARCANEGCDSNQKQTTK